VPRDLQALLHNDDHEPNFDECLQCLTPELTLVGLKNALSSIADAAAIDSAPNCAGMLSASSARLITSKTVQLKLSQLASVERSDELIRLRTHGQVLEFTDPLRTAIEQLLTVEKLETSTLEGLDDDQKQTLYTRLLCANLLIVDER
jgi:hypothetical protein